MIDFTEEGLRDVPDYSHKALTPELEERIFARLMEGPVSVFDLMGQDGAENYHLFELLHYLVRVGRVKRVGSLWQIAAKEFVLRTERGT